MARPQSSVVAAVCEGHTDVLESDHCPPAGGRCRPLACRERTWPLRPFPVPSSSWGVCFTYGTWFGLEAFACMGETYRGG